MPLSARHNQGRKSKFTLAEILGILGVLALFALVFYSRSLTEDDLAKEFNAISVDQQHVYCGPFLPSKNNVVYKITTKTDIFWVRDLFGRTIYKENKDGTYTQLQ